MKEMSEHPGRMVVITACIIAFTVTIFGGVWVVAHGLNQPCGRGHIRSVNTVTNATDDSGNGGGTQIAVVCDNGSIYRR